MRGAHLAELVSEHLTGMIIRGIDAVARGLGGGDEGHETNVWNVAHPVHAARYPCLRGDREREGEDYGCNHRSEESLYRRLLRSWWANPWYGRSKESRVPRSRPCRGTGRLGSSRGPDEMES
jgi:hypothetical protein